MDIPHASIAVRTLIPSALCDQLDTSMGMIANLLTDPEHILRLRLRPRPIAETDTETYS